MSKDMTELESLNTVLFDSSLVYVLAWHLFTGLNILKKFSFAQLTKFAYLNTDDFVENFA